MTLPDPLHPAYAVPCRAEPADGGLPAAGADGRAQLYLALRARDGRPFAAAAASTVRPPDAAPPPVADRAQLSLFGR